jgi:hypothetical protein
MKKRRESIKLGWSEKRPTEVGYYQLRDFFESTDDYMDDVVKVSNDLSSNPGKSRRLVVWFIGEEEELPLEDSRFKGSLWKELEDFNHTDTISPYHGKI